MAIEIALFEPDIPQNVGTILRLGACLGIAVHVIEPCGFPFSKRTLKRSLMDYEAHIDLRRHDDWQAFDHWRKEQKRPIALATTKASEPFMDIHYQPDHIILMGSESRGVPDQVHRAANHRILIPMRPGLRSINVALSAAMIVGEAMRQTGGFPRP